MSNNWHDSKIPNRWLHCPRKSSKLIGNKFLAFKTPLSSDYDNQVQDGCRWNSEMLFSWARSERFKLGLWIDLTYTTRFYDKEDVEVTGCKYLKLKCRGHEETPSENQVKEFIEKCRDFISKNPSDVIGVHCTHGFNRTGFLICCYFVETEGMSLRAALAEFADARPPGIYKGDYIQELYRRYDNADVAPPPPEMPDWCFENDSDEDNNSRSDHRDGPPRKRRKESSKNAVFMAGVPGVSAVEDSRKVFHVQRRVREILRCRKSGFLGSQPISMDRNNITLLGDKPYQVSWKADGSRYMMFIQGDGQVFFLDRRNNVFQLEGCTFPADQDFSRILQDTLLDGEMVIDFDKELGTQIPRYLAYDVVMFDGTDMTREPFIAYGLDEKQQRIILTSRYKKILNIITFRTSAFKSGKLQRESEPISVRCKEFHDLKHTGYLLSDKFTEKLGHEPDGLIFQPAEEPYTSGTSPFVLKWKPPSMNSVDFRLKIVTEHGEGIVPKKIGRLYVCGPDTFFSTIKLTKDLREMNNKIIECKYVDGKWIYMRERTDKSFPNSLKTAEAVCKSIVEPVTSEMLLRFIKQYHMKIKHKTLR